MSQKGRKPDARFLKLVPPAGGGEYRLPEKASSELEPAPAMAGRKAPKITPPSDLPPPAKIEYKRVVALLIARNQWSELFRAPAAIYARAWSEWVQADREIRKKGEGAVITSPNGYPIQNPWLAVRNGAAKIMLQIAGDMGLDLVSQVRVADAQLDLFDSAAETDQADNAFAGL